MVETPLSKVARLVGGVVLMQGRLGHQVLGQMLIAGTSELAVAGAAIAISATERVRNPAAQVAIRTAAPAIALTALFERREQMLLYRERELLRRAKDIVTSDFRLETENGVLKRGLARLDAANADLKTRNDDLNDRNDVLNKKRKLSRNQVRRLRAAVERERLAGRDFDLALKSERSALKSSNEKLQKAKTDLEAEAARLTTAVEAERLEKSALTRGNEVLVAANADLEARTTALNNRSAVLDKKCELFRNYVRRLKAAVERKRLAGGDLDPALESERSALTSHSEKLQQANTDLQTEVAALHKKSALADQVHHEFEHALKHLRVERSTLKNDKARCVVEKYILQRRNTDLRDEIKALRKAIGADETAASETDEAPPDTTGPKPK